MIKTFQALEKRRKIVGGLLMRSIYAACHPNGGVDVFIDFKAKKIVIACRKCERQILELDVK